MLSARQQNGGPITLLAFLLLTLSSGCGYSWWESYRYNKEEPYDLHALYSLLEARPSGFTHNRDTLGALDFDSSLVASYLYVGANIYLDEEDVTSLLNFVEAGNKAMLITKNIPNDISYHLFGPNCYYFYEDSYYSNSDLEYVYDTTLSLFLTNPALLPKDSVQLYFAYDSEPIAHSWGYLREEWLCDPGFGNEILGTLDSNRVNFIRLRYGEGELLVHTNPELFTNYYLTDSSRYHYALGVLSYLGDGPVIWDEYARNYHLPPSQRNQSNYNPNGGRNLFTENHALRYILEQPPLALAWYLLLIGGFLYVIFRGKRRQRIVPFRTKPENSSRQFVDTIARLAYQHGNHAQLAKREITMLRQYLQERFQVRWPEGKELPDDTALRTGLPQEVVDHAARQIRFVDQRDYIEEGDLMLFYRAIHPIYQA
ncbi:hypothetical protein CEQ90_13005 [Lewinellaceae bacterium SD302]|nr:hypothetical protein CEQ90_13005 [Lewinellaceae bacterium SD302]